MSAWDEADKHNAKLLKIAAEVRPIAIGPKRRRIYYAKRAELRIAQGFHPFGTRLREPPGETCGTCKHLEVKEYAGTYFKCAKYLNSNGPATDVRKKWPACLSWEPKEKTDAEP